MPQDIVTCRELRGCGWRFRDFEKVRSGIASQRGVAALRLLFSNFAEGLRGLALLLLRMAAAFVLARESVEALSRDWALAWIVAAAAALFLAAGFLTPAWALFAGVGQMARLSLHFTGDWRSPFLLASILLALTVLGPGAYSMDRWLFGRKRLTIGPPK
jgi:uncharacterized membrane protein YphA (DoxX/SURF4 family)